MPYIVLKPFLYFVQDDIIEEATEETKSKDYTLLPNELKIAMELGGVARLCDVRELCAYEVSKWQEKRTKNI